MASTPHPLRRDAQWRRTRRGAVIYTCTWPAPAGAAPPSARALLLPGYNSSIGGHQDFLAALLTAHGVEVFALDNHAFGRSTAADEHRVPPLSALDAARRAVARALCFHGLRGYVPSWDCLVDDAAWLLEELARERGPLPTVLYGESMGGALSLSTARAARGPAREALAGIILSAPMCAIGAGAQPHPALVALGRALAVLAPTAPAPFTKDITPLIFRDESRRAEALRNPLRHAGPVRLRTAFSLKGGAARAAADAARCELPLLLLHGTADAVCPAAASRAVFAAAPATDKTLIEYDGAWHALWAESVDTRRRLAADVLGWLAARVPTRAPHASVAPYEDDAAAAAAAAELAPRAVAAARAGGAHGVLLSRPLGVGAFRDASVWTAQPDDHADACWHELAAAARVKGV